MKHICTESIVRLIETLEGYADEAEKIPYGSYSFAQGYSLGLQVAYMRAVKELRSCLRKEI